MTEPQVPKSNTDEKVSAMVAGVIIMSLVICGASMMIMEKSRGSLGGGLAVVALAVMGVGLAWATVWMGRN